MDRWVGGWINGRIDGRRDGSRGEWIYLRHSLPEINCHQNFGLPITRWSFQFDKRKSIWILSLFKAIYIIMYVINAKGIWLHWLSACELFNKEICQGKTRNCSRPHEQPNLSKKPCQNENKLLNVPMHKYTWLYDYIEVPLVLLTTHNTVNRAVNE